MKLLGRAQELELLEGLWKQRHGQLIVVTGRRRIGKSTLIEFFGSSAAEFIKIQGLAPGPKIKVEDQLKNFSEQLQIHRKGPRFEIQNWTEAFAALNHCIPQKKTVVLLDEISWMAKGSPDFPGKLKIAWDDLFKRKTQLILVLCGSVSSWIEENVLKNTDFVGRPSLHLHLREIPLNFAGQFWGKKQVSAVEKLRYLNIVGGVPRYLEELNPNESSIKNIQRLCFRPGGFLVEEFEKIFNETFEKRAIIYKKILRVLLNRRLSFVEICIQLKQEKNGSISSYLDDLVMSGFLARDFRYDTIGKKSKLSVFRISDNYVRFFLKYLEPNKDRIAKNQMSDVEVSLLPNWNQIMGFQFENLILNNLPPILKKMGVSQQEMTSCSPYFQKKTARTIGSCQIDLLITTKFGNLYVCEFKLKKQIDKSVVDEVRKKIAVLNKSSSTSVRPVLIYAGELDEEVVQSDFFANIISVEDFLV